MTKRPFTGQVSCLMMFSTVAATIRPVGGGISKPLFLSAGALHTYTYKILTFQIFLSNTYLLTM